MSQIGNPSYNFKGQVALVTGASTGIGFATSLAFAENGASVVLSDINEKALQEATERLTEMGHEVIGLVCDVADDTQVSALITKNISTFGKIDMAFNNAGIAGPSGNFLDETVEAYDALMSINLRGVWSCMRHQIKQMEKQGGGAIVNCSSLGGLVGQAGRTAYHGAKHGVLGITKSAVIEFASRGIRVNAVYPGVIDTPMLASLKETSPEAMEQIIKDQPIGRLGLPSEIAAAVLWLCSPAASFVVGAGICVDGGFTAK